MSLKLKEVERDLTQAQAKIAQTKKNLKKKAVILLSMSEPMYQNLKKNSYRKI